jgi:hypothetical protein
MEDVRVEGAKDDNSRVRRRRKRSSGHQYNGGDDDDDDDDDNSDAGDNNDDGTGANSGGGSALNSSYQASQNASGVGQGQVADHSFGSMYGNFNGFSGGATSRTHDNVQRTPSLRSTDKVKAPIDHTQEIVHGMAALDVSAAKIRSSSNACAQETTPRRGPLTCTMEQVSRPSVGLSYQCIQADYHCSGDNSQLGLLVNMHVDNNSPHTNCNASVTPPIKSLRPLIMDRFLAETAKESYFTTLTVKDNAHGEGAYKC